MRLTLGTRRIKDSVSHRAGCALNSFLSAGVDKPSALQQKASVPFAKGLDLIAEAQPGMESMVTFCAGILQKLDYSLMECQAIVLAPTRPSAQQIADGMRGLGGYLQVRLFTYSKKFKWSSIEFLVLLCCTLKSLLLQ